MAIQNSQKEVIKYLLNKGAKIIVNYEDLLKSEKVTLKISKKFHALHTALQSKSKDNLDILLQNGCSHQEVEEVIKEKTFQGKEYEDLIQHLKETLQKRSEFLAACRDGNVDKVREFLAKGVFVDSDDLNGRNAIYTAVGAGQEKVVALLLNHNATICHTGYSRTAIFKIMENYQLGDNYFNILKLLIAKELQVELDDTDKQSPRVILAKMVTTLLYKSKRYAWDSTECLKLRQHIQHLAYLNSWVLTDNLQGYQNSMDSQQEYYGSYLSSDSDSDEESVYLSNKEDLQNPRVSRVLQRTIEIEGAIYAEAQSKDKTSFERSKYIMQSRVNEAASLRQRRQLVNLREVLTDGKDHFKPNGQLHLTGGTEEGKLSPVYNATKVIWGTTKSKLSPIHKAAKIKEASPLIDRSRISPVTDNESVKYVASYRGYTYITPLWNKPARKAHRERNELNQPLYSMAVHFEASNTISFKELHQYESNLTEQQQEEFVQRKSLYADLIKRKLLQIQAPEISRLELGLSGNLNIIDNFLYDNLSVLLQVVYTTNYDLYFRLLSCEFFKNRLSTGHSPFVSTAETPYHALRYAYGIKTFPGHQDETLKPRWRANGKAERPYSGKVYIILHTLDDLKDAHRISSLLFAGKCQIPKEIAPERELSHFAYIDKDRIVYQHVAKYPSFKGKYKKVYLYKYGLDEPLYNNFRAFFNQCKANNRLDRFTNLLAEYLCAYHEMRFVKIAEQKAKERGGTLVYLDEYGRIKEDGIAATYSTPDGNLATDSPQKKHKDAVIKKETERRRNNRNHRFLINHEIFTSKDRRAEHLANLVMNMKQADTSLSEAIFQYKDKSTLIQNIKFLEQQHTTLLHYALVTGNRQLAKELIKLVPTVERSKEVRVPFTHEYINLRDKFGNTPLHLASLNGDDEIYQLLLERGADPEILNNQGLSVPAIKQGKPIVTKNTSDAKPTAGIPEQDGRNGARRRLDFDQVADDVSTITGGLGTLTLGGQETDPYAFDNAFNQYHNMEYQYQGTDINAIGHKLIRELADHNIIYVGGLGRGHDQLNAEAILQPLIPELQAGKKVVGVYNTGGNHWVAFTIFKENDNFRVIYKDSLGATKRTDLEKDISKAFQTNSVQFFGYTGKEQIETPMVSCGLFALKNMVLFAQTANNQLMSITSENFYSPGRDDKEKGNTKYKENISKLRKEFAIKYAEYIYAQTVELLEDRERRQSFVQVRQNEAQHIAAKIKVLGVDNPKVDIGTLPHVVLEYRYRITCAVNDVSIVQPYLETLTGTQVQGELIKDEQEILFEFSPKDVITTEDKELSVLMVSNASKEAVKRKIDEKEKEQEFIQALNILAKVEDKEIIQLLVKTIGIDLTDKVTNLSPANNKPSIPKPNINRSADATTDQYASQNAFNHYDDMHYLYQSPDINTVGEQLINQEGVVFSMALGKGHNAIDIQSQLGKLQSDLEQGKKVVGVYNTGGNHWIAFAITRSTDGKITVAYNDSLGAERKDFEQELEKRFGVGIIFHKYTGLTQADGVSCGLFALKNMQILANAKDLAKVTDFYEPEKSTEGYDQSISNLREEYAIIYAQGVFKQTKADFEKQALRDNTVRLHASEAVCLMNIIRKMAYCKATCEIRTESEDASKYAYHITLSNKDFEKVKAALFTIVKDKEHVKVEDFDTRGNVRIKISPINITNPDIQRLAQFNDKHALPSHRKVKTQDIIFDYIDALNIFGNVSKKLQKAIFEKTGIYIGSILKLKTILGTGQHTEKILAKSNSVSFSSQIDGGLVQVSRVRSSSWSEYVKYVLHVPKNIQIQ